MKYIGYQIAYATWGKSGNNFFFHHNSCLYQEFRFSLYCSSPSPTRDHIYSSSNHYVVSLLRFLTSIMGDNQVHAVSAANNLET